MMGFKDLKVVGFIVALAAVLFGAAVASAAGPAILDFDVAPPTPGTISFAGGASPLVGTGIGVDTVIAIEAPVNQGVLRNLVGATVTFATGNLTGFSSTEWLFGGGGYITLKGGVDLDNNGSFSAGDIPVGTTLFQGTFDAASVTRTGSGKFRIAGAAFTDTKNTALTDFYGVTPNLSWDGNFNLSFYLPSDILPPHGFASAFLTSGDITNVDTPVPEPGTLLLLGLGLVGLGVTKKTRQK